MSEMTPTQADQDAAKLAMNRRAQAFKESRGFSMWTQSVACDFAAQEVDTASPALAPGVKVVEIIHKNEAPIAMPRQVRVLLEPGQSLAIVESTPPAPPPPQGAVTHDAAERSLIRMLMNAKDAKGLADDYDIVLGFIQQKSIARDSGGKA